jgi:hypothetical protein
MSRRDSAAAVLETTWVCDAGHVHTSNEICPGGPR